jgi:hypothetical protein
MSIFRILRLSIVFGMALIIGFTSGVKHDFVKTTAYDFSFEKLPENQDNYLIISVANHGIVQNALKGIWLVATYTDSERVDFLPIFPGVTGNHTRFNSNLADSFQLSTDGQPRPEFWAQMETINTWWNGYIILDEIATAQFFDFVSENNDQISVENIPNYSTIAWWYENPHTSLTELADLFELGCQSVNKTARHQDQFPFLIGFYLNLKTDLSPQTFITMWSKLGHYNGNLRCEFPLSAQAAIE